MPVKNRVSQDTVAYILGALTKFEKAITEMHNAMPANINGTVVADYHGYRLTQKNYTARRDDLLLMIAQHDELMGLCDD